MLKIVSGPSFLVKDSILQAAKKYECNFTYSGCRKSPRSTIHSLIGMYGLRKRLQNNSRSGRPRKINQYTGRVIIRMIKTNPKISAMKIVEHVKNSLNIDVPAKLKPQNLQPTVKPGVGSVLVWGCMSAAGVSSLEFMDGIMNHKVYIETQS
ncbi:uncharacterized protein LOC143354960 [Halictus rubicundus]|uniref:uncharacterized protein LOC143354960 n=1 Tax=Halictus rubicundus TaxID=77578 RepID=UPI004035AD01